MVSLLFSHGLAEVFPTSLGLAVAVTLAETSQKGLDTATRALFALIVWSDG